MILLAGYSWYRCMQLIPRLTSSGLLKTSLLSPKAEYLASATRVCTSNTGFFFFSFFIFFYMPNTYTYCSVRYFFSIRIKYEFRVSRPQETFDRLSSQVRAGCFSGSVSNKMLLILEHVRLETSGPRETRLGTQESTTSGTYILSRYRYAEE